MNKSVRIVKLDIDEMDDFSGVDAISLVEEPAIEADFMYFSKVNPHAFESYSDYPDSVSNNAKRGIELNEKVNNKCATQVGKVRAQQLAKKEPISVETIKRMYSYLSRAEEYYDESNTKACGTISYLLWGGLAGKRWAESKLKELDLFEGAIDVSGLAPYINEPSGSLIVKLEDNNDKEMVDGIVELLIKVEDIDNRKEMVIDTIKDFAIQGVKYDLDDFLQRVGVTMSDLNFVENAGGFSVGDYVSWTFAGRGDDADRGRGQITDLRVSGEVNIPNTDVTLTATEEEPVALIRTRSGKVIGQYTRNLRKIKKPDGFQTDEEIFTILETYVTELFDFLGYVDGLPVYSTSEEAMEVAEIAGCGKTYHEHQVGELTVYMPCESHDESYDVLLEEAHDEWMKGRIQSFEDLSQGEWESMKDYLESVAEDVVFSQDEFSISKSGIKASRSIRNSQSFLDTPTTKIRYKYDGPISSNSREFCRYLVESFTNRDKVFRKEDINNMSFAGVNKGLGPNGIDQYNIFLYRGGNNCKHNWKEVKFSLVDGQWKDTTMQVRTIADPITPRDPQSPLEGIIGPLGIGAQFSKQVFADKQLLVGPAMIPNQMIYRIDEEGEYYVYFSEDTIEKIAYKYMERKYTDASNIEHNGYEPLEDVFVVESWLVKDPKRDKSLVYTGKEWPVGTWMVAMKVKNSEVWEEYVKSGKVKGFSVEGYFVDQLLNSK